MASVLPFVMSLISYKGNKANHWGRVHQFKTGFHYCSTFNAASKFHSLAI